MNLPDPELQVNFAAALADIRTRYLQDALRSTVGMLAISQIDAELARFVPAHSLATMASHGLRGELLFAVPTLLRANPHLLGYYRLLCGYSRKEFYTSATGLGRFSGMEERGTIAGAVEPLLENLCAELCRVGALLLAAIGEAKISAGLLDDLTLLTLGPQLRGGANVRKGLAGILTVFNAIEDIIHDSVTGITSRQITVRNAAGREVQIAFAADPDIVILEEMRSGQFRRLIAIEVKAGSDFSNIHNRIGEAEKSHQKARAAGFVECWTVVNVDRIDMTMARRESPSTNLFYRISDIVAAAGDDYRDFKDRILSLTGVAGV